MQVNICSFPQAPHDDRAMRVRFWCESTRDKKNACDTVVAHFLLFPPGELPRAFPTKARSHFPITALALVFWSVKGTGYRGSGIFNDRLHSTISSHWRKAVFWLTTYTCLLAPSWGAKPQNSSLPTH